MTAARGGLIGAIAVPVAAVAVAWLVNLASPSERSAAGLVYVLGTLPLSLVAGLATGRRLAAAPAGFGVRLLGGLIALGAAFAVALIQARLRFQHLGAEGSASFGTLMFAEELAMVGSVAIGALALGAAAMSRASADASGSTIGRVGLAGLAGAVLALLVGPTLILTATLSRLGIDPLVVTLGLLVIVVLISLRRG